MSELGNIHLVTGYAGAAHITSGDHGAQNAVTYGSGDYVFRHGDEFAASISNGVVAVKGGHLMMQGRYVIQEGEVQLAPTLCPAWAKRHDLIVARYTKDNTTGHEYCSLVVVEGTAIGTNPQDPAIGAKNILTDTFSDGDSHDFPLWRVVWNGSDSYELKKLFMSVYPLARQIDMVNDTVADLVQETPSFQFGTASIRYRNYKESEVTVKFPSAFAKKPLVLTTQIFESHPIIVKEDDITTTGFTARVGVVEGGGASGEEATYRDFSWVAIKRL